MYTHIYFPSQSKDDVISSYGSRPSLELTHRKITQTEKHPLILDCPSRDYINCNPEYISF